jgi:hypothetical protein
MFNGEEDKAVIDALHRELKPSQQMRVSGEPEELVSRYFN